MISVFIAESNSASDFYEGRVDGYAANEVLKVRRLKTVYRVTFDVEHLKRALSDANEGGFNVFHLSCHGNDDGIGLTDGTFLDWLDLAKMMKVYNNQDRAIVLSACMGGHVGFSKALRKVGANPKVVFGNISDIGFTQTCIAWSILYNELAENGLEREVFRDAIDKINHVTDGKFVYRRYDIDRNIYMNYPKGN